MSLKDEFTATRQAAAYDKVERAAPPSFRAGRITRDGTHTITTRPYPDSQGTPEERDLLAKHGFDPARYKIVGPIKSSSWTAYIPKEYRDVLDAGAGDAEGAEGGGGQATQEALVVGEELLGKFTFQAKAFKFTVAERPHDEPLVDDLVKALDKIIPADAYDLPFLYSHMDTDIPYVVAVGDTQIGKELDSPTDELIQRFQQLNLRAAAAPTLMLENEGMKLEHIHLLWLGDCIEGMNSQGGRLRWRTRLTLTEQVRVLRRLMLWQIQLFAPLTNRLTVVSVPGNHDEASARDLDTRVDDSWAVDALDAVADAIALNDDYAHVETYVPGPDEHAVVLEIGNRLVAHTHGHEHPHGKHFEHWEGQAFGRQSIGDADLWLQGHGHHLSMQERGHRKWVQVPAVERESIWWTRKKGTPGTPGIATFQYLNGEITNFSKLEPPPLPAKTAA